jgi:hypothetical protein
MLKNYAYYRRKWDVNKAEIKGRHFAYLTRNIFLGHMQFWFDDISYIGTPDGERDQLEAMLETLQAAVHRGDEQRVSSPRALASLMGGFSRLARSYGLDECVVKPSSFS